MSLDTYRYLRSQKIDVSKIVEWHFENILASLKWKILLRQKYRNAWSITVTENIHIDIFYQAFRAIRDYHISYDRTIELIKYKKKGGYAK